MWHLESGFVLEQLDFIVKKYLKAAEIKTFEA